MELKKIVCAFFLLAVVSLDAAAYTVACKRNYNLPWIEEKWSSAEAIVYNYFFIDYEFTYISTLQYWKGDYSYWVPFNRANSAAVYMVNPMGGTWGLDGAAHMGSMLFNPFLISAGPIDKCSGDVFIVN